MSKRTNNGVTEKSEFFADGGFYQKNGAYYVTYDEDSKTGLSNTHTFLKILKSGVTMRKMGDFKTVISYEEGKTTDFLYETPFGKLSMKIKTTKIEDKLFKDGGTLKIFYTLLSGGEDVENEIMLNVKLRSENDEI